MYIQVMKSKIHRVTVTDANLNYIGSITLIRTSWMPPASSRANACISLT